MVFRIFVTNVAPLVATVSPKETFPIDSRENIRNNKSFVV
jgi:hypothetical protein